MQYPDEDLQDNAPVQSSVPANITSSDNNSPTNSSSEAPQLSDIELRVLGVLMEKQLTTPDQYPLTLNSVITACNQKSSREPITSYDQGEVHRALQALADKKFIKKERSSRSEKFSQQFMQHLELGRKQQALLCVMMLRGPQTISELSTRTQRMCEFADREELEHCIDRLCNRQVPYAIRLGQQPGQRGERIGHLFAGLPQVNASNQRHSDVDSATQTDYTQKANITAAHVDDSSTISLENKVAKLSESINALQSETAVLKQQLAALYALTGHAK